MEAYVIVGSSNMKMFEIVVNDAISDGYVPQGGMTVEPYESFCEAGADGVRSHYMQAMYKAPTKTVKPQNKTNDITELDLSKRTINILLSEGIDIDKLRTMSKIALLKLPNCGIGTTDEILNALHRDGGMK